MGSKLLVTAILVVLAGGAIVGGALISPAPAQDKPAAVLKWEYKVVDKLPSEGAMNKLGDEGWEAVGFSDAGAGVSRYYIIYKRPKR